MQEVIIDQQLMPSKGAKLICTRCGRENFHTLILRRRRGLLEGLCKQQDGSGCYPNSPRTNCTYVNPDKIACTQLAEWELVERSSFLTLSEACTDHIGLMLSEKGADIYPLED